MSDSEFETKCWICNQQIIKKKIDGKWGSYNFDATEHPHENVISATSILSKKYYPSDKEDLNLKINELTMAQLEEKIEETVRKQVRMQVSTFLASWKGFGNGPRIQKEIEVDGKKYIVTGKLDKLDGDNIIEAKFAWTFYSEEKNLDYAFDQCDIYGWITGKHTSTVILHNIEKNETKEYPHLNDQQKGEKIIIDHIRNHFNNQK